MPQLCLREKRRIALLFALLVSCAPASASVAAETCAPDMACSASSNHDDRASIFLANPGVKRGQKSKKEKAAAYLNRNQGVGIPRPEFSAYTYPELESSLSLVEREVNSRIRSDEGCTWAVPDEVVEKLLQVLPASQLGFRFVILYLRVSSEDQREESDSLQDQLRELLTLCLRYGFVPLHIVWENASGKNYTRAGLDRAYDLIDQAQSTERPIHGLFVWKMNRFGREAIEGMQRLVQLASLGAHLIYRRRSNSRLHVADLADPEEKDDAWEALREAEEQGREIEDGQKRGYQGDANKGKTYGPRLWLLYATKAYRRGMPYEAIEREGMEYVHAPGQKGQVLLDHYMFKKTDAGETWKEIVALANDAAHAKIDAAKAFRDFAKKHGYQLQDLIEELQRPLPAGRYQCGETVSERVIPRLLIHAEDESRSAAEYALVRDVLDSLETRRQSRVSKIVQEIQKTSMTFVHILSGKDVCPRCTVYDEKKQKKCGRPGDFLTTNREENHRGNDLYWCGKHAFSVPNDRVLMTTEEERPPECGGCRRFEFFEPAKHVSVGGIPLSLLHCKECGADNYCTYESDPARRKAIERRAARDQLKLTLEQMFDLGRQARPSLSSGQVGPGGSRSTARTRGRAKPPAATGTASDPAEAPPGGSSEPRQTSLESQWPDEASA